MLGYLDGRDMLYLIMVIFITESQFIQNYCCLNLINEMYFHLQQLNNIIMSFIKFFKIFVRNSFLYYFILLENIRKNIITKHYYAFYRE